MDNELKKVFRLIWLVIGAIILVYGIVSFWFSFDLGFDSGTRVLVSLITILVGISLIIFSRARFQLSR